MIRFDREIIGNVANRHRGRFSQKFRKRALMNRVEVLDQNEGHSGIDR
jgi:hypothetical protein